MQLPKATKEARKKLKALNDKNYLRKQTGYYMGLYPKSLALKISLLTRVSGTTLRVNFHFFGVNLLLCNELFYSIDQNGLNSNR